MERQFACLMSVLEDPLSKDQKSNCFFIGSKTLTLTEQDETLPQKGVGTSELVTPSIPQDPTSLPPLTSTQTVTQQTRPREVSRNLQEVLYFYQRVPSIRHDVPSTLKDFHDVSAFMGLKFRNEKKKTLLRVQNGAFARTALLPVGLFFWRHKGKTMEVKNMQKIAPRVRVIPQSEPAGPKDFLYLNKESRQDYRFRYVEWSTYIKKLKEQLKGKEELAENIYLYGVETDDAMARTLTPKEFFANPLFPREKAEFVRNEVLSSRK